jgi:hypothetical protein
MLVEGKQLRANSTHLHTCKGFQDPVDTTRVYIAVSVPKQVTPMW